MYFATAYKTPMDRGYQPMAIPETTEAPVLEEPIVPLRQLGATVVEKLPGGGGNIIQNTEVAIRAGMPNIQLVFTTPSGQPIGGRPKAYGTEVREAIRSMAKANEVLIEGVELPSGSVNLSGFDQQSYNFREQKRQEDLNEVRDYIKFAGDVAGGGGIDIWSAEFPRTVFDASWNTKDPKKGVLRFQLFEGEKEQGTKFLVDKRTGRVIQEVRLNEKVPFPEWLRSDRDYTDENGKKVKKGDFVDYEGHKVKIEDRVPIYDPIEKRFKVKSYDFEAFKQEADDINRLKSEELGRPLHPDEVIKPEEAFLYATTLSQESIARGYELQYTGEIDKYIKAIEDLKKAKTFYQRAEGAATSEEERMLFMRQAQDYAQRVAPGILPPKFQLTSEAIGEGIEDLRKQIKERQNMAAGQRQQAEQQKRIRDSITTLDNYAKTKLFDSYAQMGIFSMQETQMNKNVERPLYVGPEIGWPMLWGGHPDEFRELIKESRKRMTDLLSKPLVDGKPNPHYSGMDEKTAHKHAVEHIKGCFDTSHLGMWLNNFRRVPGESEDARLQEFKKWYLDEVEKIAKDEDLIGSIQAVDSASGAHGHLPPGQGIFPVVEAVEIFKKHGFKGAVISEGHEEEQFGQQRIFLQAMKAFGTTLTEAPGGGGSGGIGSTPYRWGSIRNAYFGRTYVPLFIVGAYSPSNDFKLWSEVPLE